MPFNQKYYRKCPVCGLKLGRAFLDEFPGVALLAVHYRFKIICDGSYLSFDDQINPDIK